MTWSVKCGFGWQRKESLYLSNSKRLHATAPRVQNAKLACHGLVEMSFPYVWRSGSIFSCKKISSFAISMAPALLFVFFFQQHIAAVEFPFFFFGEEMRELVVVVVGGGCFFFQSLPGTGVGLRIWFHARKIQALSCCWFGWSGVSLLIPTGLSKSFCSLSPSLALSPCLSLHLSHSVLNLGFGVKLGRGSVAWGHHSSGCCPPRRTRSPLNWSRWKCVGQTAVGIDSCVPSGETGLDAYHNTLMGLCSFRFLAGSPEESGTVQ